MTGRPANSYRGARRNAARQNQWERMPVFGMMGLRTTWHQPVARTDKNTRFGTPIMVDGTLDGSFKGVIRPNERDRSAGARRF